MELKEFNLASQEEGFQPQLPLQMLLEEEEDEAEDKDKDEDEAINQLAGQLMKDWFNLIFIFVKTGITSR